LSEFARESWWTIEAPRLFNLAARQHPLPGQRQQRSTTVLWELTGNSDRHALEAAAACGESWARELGQDPPLSAHARRDWDNCRVWIWAVPGVHWHSTVIGACSFALDTATSVTPFFRLQFLWLHPFARHRGNWAEAFPLFLRKFEKLRIEPLTSAMQRFLAGRPTTPVKDSHGGLVHLYSEEPGCPRGHGPMQEYSAGLWLCGAVLGGDRDNICKGKWAAPARVRPTQER
jgi:hypothetical protein